ncbi:MAG: molybdopterin-dependent oxidoreductase [Anaerolineae bacterium]|nr:molybdopterin-dependent oxidoreductase [Anaerolineae bacterium]
MSDSISRRRFLQLTGLGAAAAVMTGCGPASRYVVRRPYTDMPEYARLGESTYYATTCTECPAGCGMIMRTFEGRAIKAEGNPAHPVNSGKLCSRGLTAVQGLYNPDRIKGPARRAKRGEESLAPLSWDEALGEVKTALSAGVKTAFLLGLAPDHLYDLVSELAETAGTAKPVRYGALGMFEARATLVEAARQLFGEARFPFFDVAGADLVISFGANFLETWLSPVAYTRGYSQFRRSFGADKARGYFISFEARRSLTSGVADEWHPVVPGSEGLLALALANLLAERGWNLPVSSVDPAAAAEAAGISLEALTAVADRAAKAARPLFIPGGQALAHSAGLEAARSILALNLPKGTLGQSGGMSLSPAAADAASMKDVQALVDRMNAGQVETLFVHGVNPLFELPAGLNFAGALGKVKRVISFATYPDETALQADLLLPDHSALESWGYQRTLAGTAASAIAARQPVVVPLYDTRSSVDVLLSAGLLPYADEVEFIQSRLLPVLSAGGGNFDAAEIETFWARFLQYGGWWSAQGAQPAAQAAAEAAQPVQPQSLGEGKFRLVVYPTQLGDGSGANRPWLQETPNTSTTVMWNSWVEINPKTAEELGLHNDDVVLIKSDAGEVEASVYLFPAIRPDTLAIPFGQGHTALGRYAEGRGCNPAEVLAPVLNAAGDLALGDTLVSITPTGRRRPLSRYESKVGVYGEH